MAIDMADFLENNDFYIIDSDRYKAYNLINDTELIVFSEDGDDQVKFIESSKFPENPTIGLGLGTLIEMGLSVDQIRGVVVKYLTDFNVNFNSIILEIKKVRGILTIILNYD